MLYELKVIIIKIQQICHYLLSRLFIFAQFWCYDPWVLCVFILLSCVCICVMCEFQLLQLLHCCWAVWRLHIPARPITKLWGRLKSSQKPLLQGRLEGICSSACHCCLPGLSLVVFCLSWSPGSIITLIAYVLYTLIFFL